MNKSYRIVWNRVRNCLMVVSETTKSQGKAGAAKAAVIGAVAAAVMGIGAADAWAVTCASPITGSQAGPCNLTPGQSLTIDSAGTITGTKGISIGSGTTAGTVVNNGAILGTSYGLQYSGSAYLDGITNTGVMQGASQAEVYIAGNASIGGIDNLASGTITSGNNAFYLSNAKVMNGIRNAGLISSTSTIASAYVVSLGSTKVFNGISNTVGGTIQGINAVNISRTTISGGFTNAGLITAATTATGRSAVQIKSASYISGGFYNLSGGTISAPSGNYALQIKGSTLSGDLYNAGLISGGYAVNITGTAAAPTSIGGSINNAAGGTIQGIGTRDALYLSYTTLSGGISNSGLIQGPAAKSGIAATYSTIVGGLTNNAGGTLVGGIAGLSLKNARLLNGVVNDGLLSQTVSSGTNGAILVLTGATLSGGILNTGTIQAAAGIAAKKGSILGGITNAAMITSSASAIYLRSNSYLSGGLSNSVGGTIAASGALSLASSTWVGGISNYGLMTLTGTAFSISAGSSLSGNVVNNSGATIRGLYSVFSLNSSTLVGDISNYGLITNSGALNLSSLITIGGSAAAGSTLSGNIYNQAGAVMSAAASDVISLQYANVSGSVVNSGLISTGGVSKAGVRLQYSTVGGTISNTTDATISGVNNGVYLYYSSLAGGISSSGLISNTNASASYAAIQLTRSTISGGVNNLAGGTIAGGVGVLVKNTMLVGGFSNSGMVSGTASSAFGFALQTGSSMVGGVLNTSTIKGNLAGLQFVKSTTSGDITNSGLITASGNYGINISAAAINGAINNTVGGTIGGKLASVGTGIRLYATQSTSASQVTGGVFNSGLITGYGEGIKLNNATLSGGLVNNAGGTISGQYAVDIYLNGLLNGGITNAGVISGNTTSGEGVRVGNGTLNGSLVNNATGSITGVLRGLDFSVAMIAGGITNSGLIGGGSTSGGIGIYVNAASITGGLVNNAGGTIQGYNAIQIAGSSVGGGFTNAGLISGNTAGGYGLSFARTLTGDLVNMAGGTLSGKTGIKFSTGFISGGIANAGLIAGNMSSATGMALNRLTVAGNIYNSASGVIAGKSGIKLTNASVAGGITNAGLIVGATTGTGAINVTGTTRETVLNLVGASIVGAIKGNVDVTNSGYWALQSLPSVGGTISPGSSVAATISGNYVQDATGVLSIGVNGVSGTGTVTGNYSQLAVSGTAAINGGTVNVSMSNDSAVSIGRTLAGVVTASGLTATNLTITDNSALVNFVYVTTAGALSLAAIAGANPCGATISGFRQGFCEVAFDAQTVYVASSGSIGGGTLGIKVLTGAITAGGIVNAGTIIGSVNAVQFLVNGTFTGNLSNTGLIQGATGIRVASTINGTIINTVGGSIVGTAGAGVSVVGGAFVSNGIQNSGYISSVNNAGSMIGLVNAGSVASVVNSGTLSSLVQLAGTLNALTNSGLIKGVTAINIDGGVLGSITNTGSINGSGVGLAIGAGGTLSGLNNQRFVSSIDNTGVLAALVNSGSISSITNSASLNAMNNIGTVSTLVNTGTIIGLTTTGSIGGISNSTVITASGYAIAINGGQVDSITNSGFIGGGTGAISVAGSATLNNILIIGNNTASFGGAVDAVNTAVTVAGSTTYTLNSNFNVSNFANEGIVVASGSPTITGNLSNAAGASVIGAISGLNNISNSGLLALQTMSGGTIVGGSHVSTSISGNYVQNASTAVLSIGTNGTSGTGTVSGNYSQLAVGGVASLTAGSINVSMSSSTAVQGGGTLAGVVSSASNQLTATGLSITDNSALVDFFYTTTAGVLSLVAMHNTNACGATITGTQQGPCEIAYDNQTIYVAGSGSIGGAATGIKVLSGAITAGSIVNTGTVIGSAYGINILAGSTFTGGITNSGLIAGGTNAIYVDSTSSIDRIVIAGNNTASFGGAVYAPNTPVTVAGGATYTLNSNFEVSNFNNQGILIAPVASVASPTITGNLTLGNTGTFAPTVASQTSYTQITVSGNASIAGALAVNAAAVTTIAAGSTLAGLITAASVSGVFGSYTDNSVLYDFVPVYNGTMVGLVVIQNSSGASYTSIAQSTGNLAALGVAGALQQISTMTGVMTPVTTAFGQMTSNQQISNAMSQTLPVMSGATTWNTMSVLTGINRIIEARHLVNKGISSGEDFSGNSALWMKPFGTWTDQGNQNGAYGFKANTGGLMLGGDTTVGADTRLGLAFGWGNSYATSNAGVAPQSQTSNLYQFIGYGSYALSETLEANFQANGGWNSNTSNRQIGFMGTSAQGSYNSAVWHVGAGLSNPYHVTDTTQLIPSARFDYTWIKNQGYSETGASNGLGLNVNSETYQTSILGADLKGIQKLSDHNSVNANIGVGYNFSPTQTWVAASFQGAPGLQFTTNGINPQAVMGRAGVGYTYKVNNGLDLGVRYDLDFQSSYTNQTATAKARWMF